MKLSIHLLLAAMLACTLATGCGAPQPTSVTESAEDAEIQAYKDAVAKEATETEAAMGDE